MAAFTEAQLKKMSPEERKARAKRIEYQRAYDARKREEKGAVRPTKTTTKSSSKVDVVADDATKSAKLKSLVAELEVVETRVSVLLQQIRDLA